MATDRLTLRSALVKKGNTIIRTSIKLEPYFWQRLEEICDYEKKQVNDMVQEIDGTSSGDPNRAGAIRLYVVEYFRSRAVLANPPIHRELPLDNDSRPVSPNQTATVR